MEMKKEKTRYTRVSLPGRSSRPFWWQLLTLCCDLGSRQSVAELRFVGNITLRRRHRFRFEKFPLRFVINARSRSRIFSLTRTNCLRSWVRIVSGQFRFFCGSSFRILFLNRLDDRKYIRHHRCLLFNSHPSNDGRMRRRSRRNNVAVAITRI